MVLAVLVSLANFQNDGGDDVGDDDGDVGDGCDLEDLCDDDQTNLSSVPLVLGALEQHFAPFQTIINSFAHIYIFTNVALFCQKKKSIYKPALQLLEVVIFTSTGGHFLLLVFLQVLFLRQFLVN